MILWCFYGSDDDLGMEDEEEDDSDSEFEPLEVSQAKNKQKGNDKNIITCTCRRYNLAFEPSNFGEEGVVDSYRDTVEVTSSEGDKTSSEE